jgi:hypothetical protein
MCSSVQMNYLAVDKVSGFQIEQQMCNFSNLGQSLQWTQLPKKFMRFDGIHRCVYNTGRNGIEANTLDRNSIASVTDSKPALVRFARLPGTPAIGWLTNDVEMLTTCPNFWRRICATASCDT